MRALTKIGKAAIPLLSQAVEAMKKEKGSGNARDIAEMALESIRGS